jgi:NADPH:quinone reductase-like Zn-dependent oxidoreductase
MLELPVAPSPGCIPTPTSPPSYHHLNRESTEVAHGGSTMKILLTGAAGQLGQALRQLLEAAA